MEDTHITDPERIEKLQSVLAIDFSRSYKLGVVQGVENLIPLKPHGKPLKSLFRFGLDCLRSILTSTETKLNNIRKSVIILIIYY